MKTKLILLAALMLGGVAQTHARSDSNLLRQASALECLADDIASAHRRSLAGHRIEGANERLLVMAHAMQGRTDLFLNQVRSGEDYGCLSNTLTSLQRSIAAVRSQASCMRVSPVTRDLISQFASTLAQVRISNHGHGYDNRFGRGNDSHNDRHEFRSDSPRRESVSGRDVLADAIGRIIGGR